MDEQWERLQPAAMVDLDVIAVAAAPAVETIGNGDSSVCSGNDGCALGTGNVGAGLGAYLAGDGVHAVAELRGNRTRRNRQWPLQRSVESCARCVTRSVPTRAK